MNSTTTYESASQKARKALKAAGYKANQVSIRTSRGGGSFTATVRSADVSLLAVEEIVNQFESIDRCEYSGEILAGGNTFVHVQYSDDVRAQVKALYGEVIREAIAEHPMDGSGVRIKDLDQDYYHFNLWFDEHRRSLNVEAHEDNWKTHSLAFNQRGFGQYYDPKNDAQVESTIEGLAMVVHATLDREANNKNAVRTEPVA